MNRQAASATQSIDVEDDRQISVEIDRTERDWKHVDAALRSLAKRRSGLDAEEARWLRAAARVKIWRELGCVSLLDYLERRLGYAPRTAQERVRVALALAELPQLERALADGMPFSAVRELTRIATRDTERAWIDKCRGTSVHEIEQCVSGRSRGDLPTAPARPDLATRPITFEHLKPTTRALLREARGKAQDQRGQQLSDDELLALLCGAFLEGNASESSAARYQVAVTVCEVCQQGWQTGRGRKHAMDRSEVERALCDAQHIGSLDEPAARAVQDVAPRVRRFVRRRDGGTCRMPGCRSAANLELHHIVPRASGGTHDPENLILLCDGCHSAHHRGALAIRGTSSELGVARIALDAGLVARVDSERVAGPDVARDTDRDVDHDTDRDADRGANPNPNIDADTPDEPCAKAPISTTGRPHAVAKHGRRTGSPGVQSMLGPSRFGREAVRAEARAALQGLGFRRDQAASAVDYALTQLAPEATLETVIRAALRATSRRQ